MSSTVLKKPRVLRCARAIIVGESKSGELEYLLVQRSKITERHSRMWECIGGSEQDKDGRLSKTLVRESAEEIGIPISKIIQEVYNEHRPWEANGSLEKKYDEYHATFYLADTPTIKEINLTPEHSGHGWFSLTAILLMKKIIRPSTHRAFQELNKKLAPAEIASLMRVNPKHH